MGKAMVVGSVLALATACFAGAAVNRDSCEWEPENKKVISFGHEWHLSDKEMIDHAARIEEAGLDGIGLTIGIRNPDGKLVGLSALTLDSTEEWKREWLKDRIPMFRKAMSLKGLQESFLMVMRVPSKRIAWEDDAKWALIAKNMGVLAWFARECGIRGLAIDPENYTPAKQFDRLPTDRPWKEVAVQVRRRMRQVFAEAFKEYPEAVVLSFWLQSNAEIRHCHEQDPLYSLSCTGDLLPMLVNGILDVMPPTATLVDGCEFGYQYDAAGGSFEQSAIRQRDAVLGLIAPENRRRFRQCFEPGFGLYTLSYINDAKTKDGKEETYYFPPYRGSRLGYFERNLASAVRCAGKYVWIWSEKLSWIDFDKTVNLPTGQWGVSREVLSNRLPGLNHIVRACANPKAFLAKDFPTLRKSGRMPNIAEGVDAVKKSKEALYGSTGEKADGKKGIGYFLFGEPKAEPGSHYVVTVDGHGEGLAADVMWLRQDMRKWKMPRTGVPIKPVGEGKYHGELVVAVPEGADYLQVVLSLNPAPGEECIFDKLYLGQVPVK